MAATTGDVIMRSQIILKRHPQERPAFFPLFLSSDRLVGFIPEVFCPAICLEQKQFHILDWRRPARLIGYVTLPAAGAYSDRVHIMWPSFICSRGPGHRMADRSAESVGARPDHRRVRNGNQDDSQCYKRQTRQDEGDPASPLWSVAGNVSRSGEILHARFITRIESVLKLAVLLAQTTNTDCRERPGAYDKNRRKHHAPIQAGL
jgi:hypothetical protein